MRKRIKLRKFLYVLTIVLGALIVSVVILYAAIQPPILIVPDRTDLDLKNITIWNPGSDIIASQTLHISDGVIKKIEPSQPNDISVFCEGCFAVPGLIDAHVHTPPKIAIGNQDLFSLLYLKYGVTSVRDLGQFDDSLSDLVERITQGKLFGPRIYRCGRILDGDPPSVPGAILVENYEDGQRAVASHADQNVDCIKIYGNLSLDAFKGVSEAADQFGLPLVGHTPNKISFNDIQNFESQHYTGIPYLAKPAPTDWAYKSQDLINMTQDEIDNVLDVMVENKIAFLPTNANLESRLTVSDRERFPPSEGFQHMPEFWEVSWPNVASAPKTNADIQTELNARPYALSFIQKAHARNIDVLVGTDVIMPYVIPGESMHQQLAIMAEALGSSEAALEAATRTNGNRIDAGKIGEIKTGAFADILLFKSDPRGSLENLKNWDYAIVDGRLYTRADVDAAVRTFEKHFKGRLYSTVTNMAYGFLAGDYEDSEVSKH